ncbi:type VI secretion system baseplate subunit TssF [Meridianimarinicoccus aquatilis]|uniref:Type VI secretion system baseplate subunit TssF n=1 Tax=Meridianimarinicoccus aquatilis TaxID=2552766 RepID=A0A4R6ARF4_9RHOB|nr:type VI secretion system baseplate subunit TssF [Fluviibacterium aquatile]TDL85188.1 type VI secretion system baseplate subunit TssF [Fluviibacterium aquatile]
MDTRLLRHYETELAFMREMGSEFAQSFPKVAARLGMDGVEVLDPYVERLLEGVAFLSARVQLELELQYPALTSQLLEIIYPHFLGPTPSMMIAQLVPDVDNAAVAAGHTIQRGTHLRTRLLEGTQTACVFRTSQDTTLWPIEIAEAEYIDGRGELVAAGVVDATTDARAGVRLRVRRAGGLPIGDLPLESLTLFLGGESIKGWQLYELLCADSSGVVARSTDRRADWTLPLEVPIRARGFEPEEALLPTPRRSFDGYRLLQEYFALPERFHFAEIGGLAPALARAEGSDLDLYILFRDGAPNLASGISPGAFRLHCVPAVNLFEKRCDRVHLGAADHEHHVVVDRTAPLDYEIHSIGSVTGISNDGSPELPFRAFYSADEFTAASGGSQAYYTQRRRMRQRTQREKLKTSRTNYLGSDLYLSLVDPKQAPYSGALTQLAVTATVTNRDLPLLLSSGDKNQFYLPDGGPIAEVRTPVAPTRPRPTLAQGDTAWKLISHLSLNYLSIADTTNGTGAEALRELIGLYAPEGDRVIERQLEGITSVTSRPIVRWMQDEALSTAVRGLEITVNCDEDFFEGSSAYGLVAVLERYLRFHVTINSFTETVLKTQQRGEIARWRPEPGLGRII